MNGFSTIDWDLFQAINTGWSNGLLDFLAPLIRNPYAWIPVYAWIVYACWKHFRKLAWLPLLLLLFNFTLTDQLSGNLIKKSVQRLRPCNDPERKEQVILRLEHCGSGYSFVSAHATNHFGLSTLLIVILQPFYRRKGLLRALLLTWAALVSLSQIYVGVHYPFDILCGAFLGVGVAAFNAVLLHLGLSRFSR